MMRERDLMVEFIEMYKNLSCLWDNREVLYMNKMARDHAYEVLLEKYKLIQADATLMDVKKKIENMRCTYRREHKKVLRSRLNGDIKEHTPSLWYYDHMQFLNEISDWSKLDSFSRSRGDDETMKVEYLDESSFSLSSPKKARLKKRNSSESSLGTVPTIYLPETHDEHIDDEDSQGNQGENATVISGFVTETESFGTTVGLQLRELDPFQRLIAEKLISDVIFNARLKKLTVDSSIELNE